MWTFSNYLAVFLFFVLSFPLTLVVCIVPFNDGLCFILMPYMNTLGTITYEKIEIIYMS